MQKTYLKLIVDNWAKTTVILEGGSYVLRDFINFQLKKKEIFYVKIQEMKLGENVFSELPIIYEFTDNDAKSINDNYEEYNRKE